jgi:hypothetical protein
MRQRLTHILGDWESVISATFSSHPELSSFPIDVIQRHGDYLARAQTEPRQKQ